MDETAATANPGVEALLLVNPSSARAARRIRRVRRRNPLSTRQLRLQGKRIARKLPRNRKGRFMTVAQRRARSRLLRVMRERRVMSGRGGSGSGPRHKTTRRHSMKRRASSRVRIRVRRYRRRYPRTYAGVRLPPHAPIVVPAFTRTSRKSRKRRRTASRKPVVRRRRRAGHRPQVIVVRPTTVRRTRVRRSRVKGALVRRYAGRRLRRPRRRRSYYRKSYTRRGHRRRGYSRRYPRTYRGRPIVIVSSKRRSRKGRRSRRRVARRRNARYAIRRRRNPDLMLIAKTIGATAVGYWGGRAVGDFLKKPLEGKGAIADWAPVLGSGLWAGLLYFATRRGRVAAYRTPLLVGAGLALIEGVLKKMGWIPEAMQGDDELDNVDISDEGAPYDDGVMGAYVTENPNDLLGEGDECSMESVDHMIDDAEDTAGVGAYVTEPVSSSNPVIREAAANMGAITEAAAGMGAYVTDPTDGW